MRFNLFSFYVCEALRLCVVVTAKDLTAETDNTEMQRDSTLRCQMMWLSIDEVVHHDDVIRIVIVRTWRHVSCNNPHRGDPRIVKLNPEERKTSITRSGRDKTAEQQTAISTEKLHQGAGVTVAAFLPWTTTVGLIDVSEDCAEAGNHRSSASV
jgi:hypothetical protein